MRLLYFLLLITFISSSCNTGKDPVVVTQKITIDTLNKIKYIEDFTESVRFVPLETRKDFEIKHINRVFTAAGKIIVYDIGSHRVVIYDTKGKILARIDGHNTDPNGHSIMTNVSYDYKNNQIVVLDLKQMNMIMYDLNAKPVAKVAIKDGMKAGIGVLKTDEGYVFNRNNMDIDGKRIALFKANGDDAEYDKSILPLPKSIKNCLYITDDLFNVSNDSLYYFPPLADSIYLIRSGKALPAFALNLHGKRLFSKTLSDSLKCTRSMELYMAARNSPEIYGTYNLHVTPKVLFFNYSLGRDQTPFSLFYSRNKKSTYVADRRVAFKNYPDNLFMNYVIGQSGDELTVAIYPDTYVSNNFAKQLPAGTITPESSSPVLLFYRPKESLTK